MGPKKQTRTTDTAHVPARRSKRAAVNIEPSKQSGQSSRSAPSKSRDFDLNRSKARFVSRSGKTRKSPDSSEGLRLIDEDDDEVVPLNPLPNPPLDASMSPQASSPSSSPPAQKTPSHSDTEAVSDSVPSAGDTEPTIDSDLLQDGFPSDCRAAFMANRKVVLDLELRYPDKVVPAIPPFSDKFISEAAFHRYSILASRGFIDMRVLALDCPTTAGARELLAQAQLLPTVTVVGKYVEQIVREFYANMVNLEYHGGGHYRVYIRGKLFEFTPELINQVLNLPEYSYVINYPTVSVPVEELMIDAIKWVSGGSIRRWKDLASKHLPPTIALLYKICCFNWLPTTNKTTLKKDRVVLLHMISKLTQFNMGKLIFDQINLHAKQCCTEKGTFRLLYPNLIYLVLQYQRPVPQLPGDVFSSQPKQVTLDPKKASGSAASSTSAFDADIAQVMHLLTRMKQRMARGEYGHGGAGNDEEEMEDDESDSI